MVQIVPLVLCLSRLLFSQHCFLLISDTTLSSSTRLAISAPLLSTAPSVVLSLSCVLAPPLVLLVVLRAKPTSRATLFLSLFLLSHPSDLFHLPLPHGAFCTNTSFSVASQSHPSGFHLPVIYPISSHCLIQPWRSLECDGTPSPSPCHTPPHLEFSRSQLLRPSECLLLLFARPYVTMYAYPLPMPTASTPTTAHIPYYLLAPFYPLVPFLVVSMISVA